MVEKKFQYDQIRQNIATLAKKSLAIFEGLFSLSPNFEHSLAILYVTGQICIVVSVPKYWKSNLACSHTEFCHFA